MQTRSTVPAMTTPPPGSQYAPAPPAPAPGRPRRRGLVAALVAGVLVLAAAGGGAAWYFTRPAGESSPAAAPASAVVQTTAAAQITAAPAPARSPLQDDPVGQQVCPAVLKLSADEVYDPDKVEPLGEAARRSADTGFARLGGLLAGSARIARASKGRESEFRDSLGMAGAATELQTRCIKDGYQRP